MLRVSRLTDYGTVVLAQMARDPQRIYSAVVLASDVSLPPSTVRKLLKQLASHGLLQSCRGQHGGYRLARPPARISLADVIEALEGPLGLTECSRGSGLCGLEPRCGIRRRWLDINDVILGALRQVSLLELAQPETGTIELLSE